MKTLITLLLIFFIVELSSAQYPPNIEKYNHYQIIRKNDTIKYHVFSKFPDKQN